MKKLNLKKAASSKLQAWQDLSSGIYWDYEKIHNRSKSCIRPAAVDDCSGIKDHEQCLDQTRSPDPDQWRQATSSKPPDTWIRSQAWASKRQATSSPQLSDIRYYVKERSKRNNRRPERTIQDAWTSVQPAGNSMYYRRQAGQDSRISVRGLLRPEGPVSIFKCKNGTSTKTGKPQAPTLGGGHDCAHSRWTMVQVAWFRRPAVCMAP